MVRDVLRGENRLLYTYGVTNSGKTYTIQGEWLSQKVHIPPCKSTYPCIIVQVQIIESRSTIDKQIVAQKYFPLTSLPVFRRGLRGWPVAAGSGVRVPEAVGASLPGPGPQTRPVPGGAQTRHQRGQSGDHPQRRAAKRGEQWSKDLSHTYLSQSNITHIIRLISHAKISLKAHK